MARAPGAGCGDRLVRERGLEAQKKALGEGRSLWWGCVGVGKRWGGMELEGVVEEWGAGEGIWEVGSESSFWGRIRRGAASWGEAGHLGKGPGKEVLWGEGGKTWGSWQDESEQDQRLGRVQLLGAMSWGEGDLRIELGVGGQVELGEERNQCKRLQDWAWVGSLRRGPGSRQSLFAVSPPDT